ncbi:glyoxalase [Sphingomonas panacis]|uniref:Glyoxalase n=1 Tax=Sphingomonas panacis TaxID=1560345 RepID=A0A1B3ZC60_9SPHN|nr:VOC family protein [Sphingomonas panacis]AOH85000.1 glyoxalase [Sphingomonas panacis]
MGVTGVGGIFFRADDPDALRLWYRTYLGVGGEGYAPWQQAAGPTVFMPFAVNTDMWPAGKPWMLNFRVDDLEALLATLRAADIPVVTDPAWDTPETGRFARVHDPEGNPIELWQPPAE